MVCLPWLAPLRNRVAHAAEINLDRVKPAFHVSNTDADAEIIADILARIVARMSAFRSACHRNNFRKSHVSDVSARILARMSVSVSVSASWNSSFAVQCCSGSVSGLHAVWSLAYFLLCSCCVIIDDRGRAQCRYTGIRSVSLVCPSPAIIV